MPGDRSAEKPEQPDDLARLPHGRHGLPAEFVARNQSSRLLASLVQNVAAEGYNSTTITSVTDGAGVTTRTFYKYFESVEACYLAAFDIGAGELGERLGAEWNGEDWPLEVRAALGAALDFFAASPQLAALLLTEPFVAGPAISSRYRETLARLVPFMREGRALSPEGESLPETTERGLLGSLASKIGHHASTDGGEDLAELLPDLAQFALTPYVGLGEARKIARSAGE